MSILANILEAAATAAETITIAGADFNGRAMAPSPEFVLPVAPIGKNLYSHQLAAVEACLSTRGTLLGLAPGMGKTLIAQAVIAAEVAHGAKAVVVVPPSLVVSPWAEEFAEDFPHLNVEVVRGTKRAPLPAADVVILGDSIVSARQDDIRAWGPTVLVADEAHRYKTSGSARTKALAAIAEDIPAHGRIVLATGTVAVNHAGEVYNPLAITGAQNATAVSGRGPRWVDFRDRWCETERIWNGRQTIEVVTGSKDPLALRERLLDVCMYSVPREEALDLPERTFVANSYVLPDADLRTYRRIEDDFLSWVREQNGAEAAERAGKAEVISRMMKLWEADGVAKVSTTAEQVRNLVAQGEPVVVMAWHSSVIAGLTEALSELRVATVAGGATAEAKADVVRDFQNGNLDVVVGQIEAAGVGLTLTRSANIVFAQLPWSPGSFAQAADRIYRIGQHRPVTIHVHLAEGTISHKLWGVLNQKAQVVDSINAGRPSTVDPSSVVSEVLAGYGWGS